MENGFTINSPIIIRLDREGKKMSQIMYFILTSSLTVSTTASLNL